MGCCTLRTQKYPRSIITSASLFKILTSQRESLLSKILFLHNLTLSCNTQIETFIINERKDLAFLLKSKKLFIKERMKDLQTLISKIDECLEDSQVYKGLRNDINKEMKKIEEELSSSLVYDKDVAIEEKPSEYVEKLKDVTKVGDMEKDAIWGEIEQEVKEYKKKTDERGDVVRRKYIKTRKSA